MKVRPPHGSIKVPFERQRDALVKAIIENGGVGIQWLTLVLLLLWGAVLAVAFYLFYSLPAVESGHIGLDWWARFIAAIVLFALVFWFTWKILGMLVPTLRVDAESRGALAGAFGGRLPTADGGIALLRLSRDQAERRIKHIIAALTKRASSQLLVDRKNIGSNVFVCDDPLWLQIRDGFHVNMDMTLRGGKEITIRILNGFYSTGTAYRYGRPVLSMFENKQSWSHSPTPEKLAELGYVPQLLTKSNEEIAKAPAALAWIISMPIPFQVSPFQLVCGVLNLDSLERKPQTDELKKLLADVATAAALIGVINRTTDVLRSKCHRPDSDDVVSTGDPLNEYLISPDEFNPIDCPEPSTEFKDLLAGIGGLEFLKELTPTSLALFLREQLRN